MIFNDTVDLAKELIKGKVFDCEHNGGVSFCKESGEFTVSLSDVLGLQLVDVTPRPLSSILYSNNIMAIYIKKMSTSRGIGVVEITMYDDDSYLEGHPPYFCSTTKEWLHIDEFIPVKEKDVKFIQGILCIGRCLKE